MMSGHYSFTSCFAPFIESMITEKRNAGFQYEHAEWILHKFDEFCNQEQVETPVITQELAGKWGTLRKTETKVTLAGRISVLRQLSLYMQAYGIKCYVPRNFTRKSNRSAYVLSIEEIQSLFLEIDSYQPTINAEVFHGHSLYIFCQLLTRIFNLKVQMNSYVDVAVYDIQTQQELYQCVQNVGGKKLL